MKKIAKFLLHPIFLSLLGLLLFALLVWFAGPQIKFGADNNAPLGSPIVRLGIIMAGLVLWGLNNLRIQVMGNKQNASLVEDIASNQANVELDPSGGQAAEEINQMNERFVQALGTLKKLRFSGGNARKALYELPWYIIVGPPGSGKTTALVNSGLDFPLAEEFGKNALQGVGGTRNCEWWFTNEAVMIDTAGRYTTQDSHRVVDSSAWEGFLNLLKKNRKRRPINGAIVAISLHDLLTQSEQERAQHAKLIRTRLDELMEKLEIRFPVYLVFTKVDLVSGFNEFFDDLSKDERDQVWGVSLPNAAKLEQSPDFDFLSDQLSQLIQRLYDRVLWRVNQERDIKRRALIEGFPKQMENLQRIVDDFTRQTFVKNRYRFQPYLRGMYLSSGTQDGSPIDRLMTSVSANFGFARETTGGNQQKGKSYFLTRLFQDVIFPEAELVGANVRYERMMKWTRRFSIAGIASLTAACVLVWTGSITQHKRYMAQVTEYTDSFNQETEKLPRWNTDIRAILPPLNALAKAAIVYDQQKHPWMSGLGMYDGRIDQQANSAYHTQLKTLLLPKLIQTLEATLKRGHAGGDVYSNFRIYMMFKKTEHKDNERILDWFTQTWKEQFEGEASRRQELLAHLNALLSLDLAPQPLDKNTIVATRQLLLTVPVSKRVYSRVKSNAEFARRVDMRNHLGETYTTYFEQSPAVEKALSIPLLYTIDGYKSTDFSKNSDLLADVVNERWILDDDNSERVDFVKDDLDDISTKVKEHYIADYIQIWNQYYRALKAKPFASLTQANDALSAFSDPVYSPLLAVLQIGKDNTRLTPIPEIKHLDKAAQVSHRLRYAEDVNNLANSKIPTTKVDKRFNGLNKLLKQNGQGSAPVDQIIARIAAAQEFVQTIAIAPDVNKKAFDVVKARFQSSSPNAITSLREYAKKTPSELRGVIESLANESWKVITQSAYQHVNTQWANQVYTPYTQALAGRYPLSSQSDNELALYDFNEFFKPSGTIDAFYNNFIKPFVNTRKNWSNKSVDGYSLGLSSNTLQQIRRAQNIKNILFRENPEMPSFSLELKPLGLGESVARFTLDVGEQRYSYNHGPKFWKPLKWSGGDENKRIRLTFEDLNGVEHDRYLSGPWAWFRLMDSANVKKTAQSNVYQMSFPVESNGNTYVATYQGKTKSIHNPFSKNLLAAFRCPKAI